MPLTFKNGKGPQRLESQGRKHPAAICEECPLRDRGRAVPSSFPHPHGSDSLDNQSGSNDRNVLAFIGEAPGRYEIAKQEVFIGPSGKLLNAVLNHYGVDREEVFLGNATLCSYPDSMKEIPKEAIECCRPRLQQELKEANVTTIVPMGNSAVQAIFPKEIARQGITKLRVGRPKPLDQYQVVPTFHPAACLRSQEKFPHMLSDIGKAVSSASLPTDWYEPTIFIVTPDKAPNLMLEALTGPSLAFLDIETGREKDTSYGNVHMERLLCVGIGLEGEDSVFVFTEECFQDHKFRDRFKKFLSTNPLGAQNGKFDLGALRAYLGYPDFEGPQLTEDTMLQSYALFEYRGVHSLEYMGMELLGTPDWKHDIKPYLKGPDGKQPTDYSNIPKDILYKYNAFDVHTTRLLHSYFTGEIKKQGLEDAYRFMVRVSNMLTLVEPRGLGFDIPYSQELAAKYQEEREDLERGLPIVCNPEAKSKKLREPHPLNPDSPDQVKKYYHDAGIELPNTEADTLRALSEDQRLSKDVRATTQLILDIRAITKMDGTFVSGLAKKVTAKGTVHPSFLIHGTTSGRLSSRSPNSQNVPRSGEIKRQFIARTPERSLVGVDFSQAELRVLTWLAKEELTRDIFNDPSRDLFVELCRSMFPDLFADQPDHFVKKHPIRPLVKGFAYGIAYGRTAAGIAADPEFNMTVQEAQKHMRTFEKTVPNIIAYLEEVADRACRGEELVNPFGRHRRFHLVTPQNRHDIRNEAKATPAQSTASDIVLEAACRLTEQGVYICNLVHDAVYCDVPKDEAEDVANLVSETMIAVGEEITEGYVKFQTEGKIGRSWDLV